MDKNKKASANAEADGGEKTPDEDSKTPPEKKPSEEESESKEVDPEDKEEADEESESQDDDSKDSIDSEEEESDDKDTASTFDKERQDWKKREDELLAQIKQLEFKNTPLADRVKKLAEKTGSDPTALLELVETIKQEVSPSDEVKKELAELKKQRELDTDRVRFEREYNQLAEKYPELKTDPKSKFRMKGIAYLKEYANLSLEKVYKLEKDSIYKPKKKTAESGRGGSQHGKEAPAWKGKKPEEITGEDIASMSDEEWSEFKKFADTGSRYVKRE